MKREGFTTHRFRSSFRNWASEGALAERELAEAALSCAAGNEVTHADAPSDLFERWRKLMGASGCFCASETGGAAQLVRRWTTVRSKVRGAKAPSAATPDLELVFSERRAKKLDDVFEK